MGKSAVLGIILVPAIVFVWPLQHTIALRNGLLAIFFCWAIYGWFRLSERRQIVSSLKWPIVFLIALTIWMYIQAFGWALAPHKVLTEITGQWLTPLAVFFLGISTAVLLPQHRRLVVRLIFAALATHVLFIVLAEIAHFIQHGELMRRYGGLAGRNYFEVSGSMDKANYLTNFYLAFLLTDFALTRLKQQSLLGIRPALLFILFLAGLFAQYVEDLRNGIVAFALVTLLTAILTISKSPRQQRRREAAIIAIALIVCSIAVGYMLSTQQRWKTFLATIPIALDTQHHKIWLEGQWVAGQVPTLPNGAPVSGSNYMRIAWAKEAVLMIAKYPLGVGFQRQAFGYALDKTYHTKAARGTHSHSGILDLTCGVGLPGLILWLAFIAGLLRLAGGSYKQSTSASALICILIVFDYSIRSLVDSIIRDHMLQMFMFLSGYFAAMTSLSSKFELE